MSERTQDFMDNFKSRNTNPHKQKLQINQLPDELKNIFGSSEDDGSQFDFDRIISGGQAADDKQPQQTPEQETVAPQDVELSDEVVIPQTISELQSRKAMEEVSLLDMKANAEKRKKLAELRKKKNISAPQTIEQKQQISEELRQVYVETTGKELSPNINLEKTVEEINSIADDVPDLTEDNLTDFDIQEYPKSKDKSGYTKTKVSIKAKVGGSELSAVATIAKNESGGSVVHRVADIRLIGNTNKTQLRGSDLMLLKSTYTFKPTGGSVNKSTRVMVSIPEDFDTEKEVIVFIQRSRDKFISKVELADKEDIMWLGKFIGHFFSMSFELAERALKFKNTEDPLVPVMLKLAKTNDFKVRPDSDKNVHKTLAFYILSTHQKNQWLGFVVRQKMGKPGVYYLNAISKVDKDWVHNVQLKNGEDITLKYLMSNDFMEMLYKLYDQDWSKYGVDYEDELHRELFLSTKLTYTYLKKAFNVIYDMGISDNDLGVHISETLSQIDTKKALNKDYAAEAIIGKTKYVDYFILTYLGVQVVGGDKRSGKAVIQDTAYRQKYAVNDDRPYQQRKNTILKKEGEMRNYNARIFMFQLEYSVDGKAKKVKAKTFDEILSMSDFLTKNPK